MNEEVVKRNLAEAGLVAQLLSSDAGHERSVKKRFVHIMIRDMDVHH
jgi:hypothetical protein